MRNLIERRPWLAAMGLVALTLLAHIVLLATPGFYAHDEWQKFDHVRLHGLWDFVQVYGVPRPGQEFGYPVRPIGFLQQGVAALWMQSAPFVSHLISVLNHAAVALTFVWVLRRAHVPAAMAGWAGVLFVLSPLTTMATGWTAASFDQIYVFFLLLVAAQVVCIPDRGLSPWRAGLILVATLAALLSKETAIVAPGLVLLLGYLAWCRTPEGLPWRPFGMAFALTLVPVVAYLFFRESAISASLAGHVTAEYTPKLENIPGNAWRFFAFPFRPKVVEISVTVFRSPWQPLLAAGIHVALVGAVARLFGMRYAVAYIAGYFLFLLPVLALPNPGTHCLYGTALAMSLAIAATFHRLLATQRRAAAALVAAASIALFAHNLAIQAFLYEHGQCQTQFLANLDVLLMDPPATRIVIMPDVGAPLHVAIRAVAAREPYTRYGQPIVVFDEATPPAVGQKWARMSTTCVLRPE